MSECGAVRDTDEPTNCTTKHPSGSIYELVRTWYDTSLSETQKERAVKNFKACAGIDSNCNGTELDRKDKCDLTEELRSNWARM